MHDINFMSSERVFGENDEMSLDIKYCKADHGAQQHADDQRYHRFRARRLCSTCAMSPTITASRGQAANILLFTIGGTQGVEILES